VLHPRITFPTFPSTEPTAPNSWDAHAPASPAPFAVANMVLSVRSEQLATLVKVKAFEWAIRIKMAWL
jgi:hypothetical protein